MSPVDSRGSREVARIVEEGGYAWPSQEGGVRWQPGARGIKINLDRDFPIGPEILDKDLKYQILYSRRTLVETRPTWFLYSAERPIERYVDAYEQLRRHYAFNGHIRPAEIGSLVLVRGTLERQLEREASRVRDVLFDARTIFAAWHVEAKFHYSPPEDRLIDLLIEGIHTNSVWFDFATGRSLRDPGWMERPRYLQSCPGPFRELQKERLAQLAEERDEMLLNRALSLEVKRVAYELILVRALLGEPVLEWGSDQEAELLPPRSSFSAPSQESRDDFFNAFDFLDATPEEDRQSWTKYFDVYRALVGSEYYGNLRYADAEKEAKRLKKAFTRLRKWREKRGEDTVAASGDSEESNAELLCKWVLRLGRLYIGREASRK